MDTTIKIKGLSIILSCFLAGCSTSKTSDSNEKKDWIFAYKAQACTSCLKNLGTEIPRDNSSWLRFEVLGDFITTKADSVGLRHTKTINEKAKHFKGDMQGGRAITNGCLQFFQSKQLDSIAEAEYEKYIKLNSRY